MKAPLPPNEEERLAALRHYEILDTVPEQQFDDITLLASRICGTPIAMISLVDETRQWFKSKVGLTATETSREIAFCAHGILQAEVFVIKDAQADERFAANPLVTGNPRIRFYAGAPLLTPDGHVLGMLCVNDQVPRELNQGQLESLQVLSRQVVNQLELRRNLRELQGTFARLKQAEETLQESEERFAGAFEHAPIGVALTAPDGRWLKVNRALCELVGYSEAELLSRTFQEITHPGDLAADLAQVERVLTGEIRTYQIEKHYVHARGHLVTVLLDVTLVRDGRGQPRYFIAQIQDITARKRTEQALRESEAHFRFLNDLTEATRTLADPAQIMAVMSRMLGEQLHASRCAYADVEPDGEWFTILHDYTDGCASTVGRYQLSLFGPKAVVQLHRGQTLIISNVPAELLPDEGADMFNAIGIQAIISCPLIRDGVLRALMAVHQTTPRDWQPGEIAIVEEVVARCWATIERRTAEERLRQNEALLRIAGRTARLGGWTVDLPDVRLTFSDEVFAILEVPPGTVLGFELALTFFTPASQVLARQAFGTCTEQGTPFDLELELITAKGRRGWVRVIIEAERNAAGVVGRVQGAMQDITARKQTELELQQTHAKLVAVSRQAGVAEFATGILHNVGNVLNSVNVASACVADSLQKSKAANLSKVVALLREHEKDLGGFLTHDPKGRQLPVYLAHLAGHLAEEQSAALAELAKLQKNIEHIREIVTTQQGLAKSSGRTQAVSLPELVEDALRMNSNGVRQPNLAVTLDCHDVPPVPMDKSRVLQILVNLVRNAAQSCEASGRSDKKIGIHVTAENGRVLIAVSDNGVGISAENLAQIFAHGFTTKPDGHGFGLHSAALAAKEMNGALTVASPGAGHGATFTLELPGNPSPANDEHPAPAFPPPRTIR